MKQLLLDIQPPAPPTLNNFIAGQNQEAIASIRGLIDNTSTSNFIYLWGSLGSGKTHLLQAAKAHDITIVDDVHTFDNEAQIALFNQYNTIKETGGKLITSGEHAPSQMALRDDLATRLAWGLVYQLHPLSDSEKAEALKQHANDRSMKLPDEVITYCLRYLRRDLPSLMSVLDALDQWSLETKKPVTVPMLKKLLSLEINL